MEEKTLVNLLLVDISVADVIVECPINEANIGDMVEFTYKDRDVIGTVLKAIFSWKDSEEYAFISDVATVHQARTVWRRSWNGEAADNQ